MKRAQLNGKCCRKKLVLLIQYAPMPTKYRSPFCSFFVCLFQLRIYVLREIPVLTDDKLATSDLYKVMPGSAMFTMPANVDLVDSAYLRLEVVSGGHAGKHLCFSSITLSHHPLLFAGDFALSDTFAVLAPAEVRPTIRLSGSSASPGAWPALEQRSVFFTTAAYETLMPLPVATISIVDDNPYGESWSDIVSVVRVCCVGFAAACIDIIVVAGGNASIWRRAVFAAHHGAIVGLDAHCDRRGHTSLNGRLSLLPLSHARASRVCKCTPTTFCCKA